MFPLFSSKTIKKFLKQNIYQTIANEISFISKYCTRFIQLNKLSHDNESVYNLVSSSEKHQINSLNEIQSHDQADNNLILFNGNFNYCHDIENLLSNLKKHLRRSDRVISIIYNPYLSWLYKLLNKIKLREGDTPTTFITYTELDNIAKIAGFEIVQTKNILFFPFKLFGLGTLINNIYSLIPLLNYFSLVSVTVLRPVIPSSSDKSLSIIIPARNEEGNIDNAIKRIPTELVKVSEVIFIEGHSKDGTWDEIQRIKEKYGSYINIKAFQQSGKGKADAVRLGFKHASGELLTILDADLTMPPEMLPRFYNSYCRGDADFINGSRLVYPMENNAMRLLNFWGNKFFAYALSFVLNNQLSDSLCGTKLFSKNDYIRFIKWRLDFGDFDPFGDFEMIFPASVLGLGTINIPIRYRDRMYGATNISRFYHGIMLLKMTAIGLLRIKFGRS